MILLVEEEVMLVVDATMDEKADDQRIAPSGTWSLLFRAGPVWIRLHAAADEELAVSIELEDFGLLSSPSLPLSLGANRGGNTPGGSGTPGIGTTYLLEKSAGTASACQSSPNAIPPGPITHGNEVGTPSEVVVVCIVVVVVRLEYWASVVGMNFDPSTKCSLSSERVAYRFGGSAPLCINLSNHCLSRHWCYG